MTLTPPLIDCVIEDPRWTAAGLEAWADESARATLGALDLIPGAFEISLLACDDRRIAALNAAFRGKPVPTNVLSWPAVARTPPAPGTPPELPQGSPEDTREALGDIALAFETCAREADAAEKPLEIHGRHLLVHGVLHLLGYDHETDPDALLMRRLEVGILRRMGIADPYLTGEDAGIVAEADRDDG